MHLVQAELFHADRRVDRQTETDRYGKANSRFSEFYEST
jgi:hypothetical protein